MPVCVYFIQVKSINSLNLKDKYHHQQNQIMFSSYHLQTIQSDCRNYLVDCVDREHSLAICFSIGTNGIGQPSQSNPILPQTKCQCSL